MNKKRKMLRIAIFMFMALSLSLTTSQTLAYWASDVTVTNDTSTATVSAGTWNQIYEWDPTVSYTFNDVITYNGVEYIAKKNNVPSGKVPPDNLNFWAIN
jgi:hypothetical protein